ncbi:hypothetical protein QFZ83_005017 [Variovorax sp. W1I1]|uniref:hypothetical protein n=1 Tax=Variovorax sp. W1I1 TaxID=3042309 RepID=UPI00277F5BB2|nr:hypothetical protein [Variovorax sp. W1I1]MDQ0610846.1 hypothetical protein [Variovorax sp. W1I1]
MLVTLHPSALLRGDPEQRAEAWKAWLDDLSQASAIFEKAPPRVRKRAAPARPRKAVAQTA